MSASFAAPDQRAAGDRSSPAPASHSQIRQILATIEVSYSSFCLSTLRAAYEALRDLLTPPIEIGCDGPTHRVAESDQIHRKDVKRLSQRLNYRTSVTQADQNQSDLESQADSSPAERKQTSSPHLHR